jgi:hypothetical protein
MEPAPERDFRDASFDAKLTEMDWIVYVCDLCLLPRATACESGVCVRGDGTMWTFSLSADKEDFVIGRSRDVQHKPPAQPLEHFSQFARAPVQTREYFPAIKTTSPLAACRSTFSKVIRYYMDNGLDAFIPHAIDNVRPTRCMAAHLGHATDVFNIIAALMRARVAKIEGGVHDTMFEIGHHTYAVEKQMAFVTCCDIKYPITFPSKMMYIKETGFFTMGADTVALALWVQVISSVPDPAHAFAAYEHKTHERICGWFKWLARQYEKPQAGTGKKTHAVAARSDSKGHVTEMSPLLKRQYTPTNGSSLSPG